MILVLAGGEHVLQVQDGHSSSFDFEGIHFSLKQGQPPDLVFQNREVPLTPGLTVQLTERIVLQVFGMDDGFDTVEVFDLPAVMTIGNSIEDDLYIIDRRLSQACISIQADEISLREGTILGRNGKRVHQSCRYSCRDVFVFAAIRFCIVDHFLILKKGAAVHCRLKRELPSYPAEYSGIAALVSVPQARMASFSRTMVVPLEEPLEVHDPAMSPLAFQMGPALTMALASCAAGILTVQQAVDSGRAWIQVMPSLVLPLTMLVSTLLWHPLQRVYDKRRMKKQMNHRYQQYAAYLSSVRKEITDFEDAYARSAETQFLSGSGSSFPPFQKVSHHGDWMFVCIGRGTEYFDLQFQHHFRFRHGDSLAFRTRALQEDCAERRDTPLLISLQDHSGISIPEDDALLETIVLQYCWYFSPSDAGIALLVSQEWLNDHRWLLEVPQCRLDGMRLIAVNDAAARRVRDRIAAHPEKHFLLIESRDFGIDIITDHVSVLKVEDIHSCSSFFRIQKNPDGYILIEADRQRRFEIHQLTQDPWLWMRRLKPYLHEHRHVLRESFLDLYPDLNLNEIRKRASLLSAPIGWNQEGETIVLDLREDRHGPHGLIAGMTGSGKSELLLTIILSLMVSHSPKDLQFVLIDFKGGGLVQMLEKGEQRAPHIAAALDNLQTSEMERALAGLAQECRYREECFQRLGRLSQKPVFHLRMYREIAEEYGMEPLSYLIVVVDEFAQLKKEHPEFLHELMSLARTGRSLGLHLLLATQKPGGIIDEQIQSNCRFRICLKVQSRSDSLEVLSYPDAADLLRPGEFYFLCDQHLQKGRAAYSSAPYGTLPKEVLILDEEMNIKKSIREPHTPLPLQAKKVLEAILEEDGSYCPRPLWKKMPASVPLCAPERPPLGIGMLDDIDHCRLPWYCLKKEGTLVQSLDASIRKQMLNTVLSVLGKDSEASDVIVLFRDEDHKRNCQSVFGHDFLTLGSEDTDRMEWLVDIVQSERSRFFWLIVICGGSFLADESNRELFLHLLQKESDHTAAIVFTDTIEAIPHSVASRLLERISFCRNDREQAMRMIGGAVDRMPAHSDGLVRIGTTGMICRFVLLQTMEEGAPGTCLLEEIPEVICGEESGDSILLGYSLKTQEKVFWNREQSLIVLGYYDEELESLKSVLRNECFRFLSFVDYERMKSENRRFSSLPVLFAGEGFREQFVFRLQRRRPLTKHEGILFHGPRKEVIRLVNAPCTSDLSDG